jgi:hypothetical protein
MLKYSKSTLSIGKYCDFADAVRCVLIDGPPLWRALACIICEVVRDRQGAALKHKTGGKNASGWYMEEY